MGLYIHRTPALFYKLFPKITWKGQGQHIYLTFDDGPSITTNAVLDILNARNIKGTFFCLGSQLKDNDAIVLRIKKEGHQIGNHSFNHENGWKTKTVQYLDSVKKTQEILDEWPQLEKPIFRPPYGRISFRQYRELRKDYRIVMWSLMSGDFDFKLDSATCLQRLKDRTQQGDVVVFHDSENMLDRLKEVLPVYIDYCMDMGYTFQLI